MPNFTYDELAKEARREAGLRVHVYPRFVASGKLKQAEGDRQIAAMVAIADHFTKLADDEKATNEPSLL